MDRQGGMEKENITLCAESCENIGTLYINKINYYCSCYHYLRYSHTVCREIKRFHWFKESLEVNYRNEIWNRSNSGKKTREKGGGRETHQRKHVWKQIRRNNYIWK